ncbi:MAG: tryptophan--tRNA ligase [Mollicutes bacterium]|nr:tryptophan--tRNA ligase [Mollicutes bacterium]
MKKIILTGDRPTGKLHIGHYIGSLKNRLLLQEKEDYDEFYIMIADAQALTDNFENPKKIKNSVIEVVLDYLSIGLDPNKVTIFIQSSISALCEMTYYYMNLVTLGRLLRNPTVKSELEIREFNNSIPSGFLNYPVSQAADITAFKANIIPVGDDQLPMIEQTNEIVRKFNNIYGNTLVECEALLPKTKVESRVPGIDGKAKMSKSLDNCIYLSDSKEEVKRKVMKMYTDPNHIKISDPGKIEGNMVFLYLDLFVNDYHFKKYLPEYKNIEELKKAYQKGGLGDVIIKKFLINVLEESFEGFRKRRKYYEDNIEEVYDILKKGTEKANQKANETLKEIRKAIGIDYFNESRLLGIMKDKYN